jgi:hypothetical protein
LVFAGAIIAVGLALISAAISRLDLFETLGADTFAVVAGFALVLLGAFANVKNSGHSQKEGSNAQTYVPAHLAANPSGKLINVTPLMISVIPAICVTPNGWPRRKCASIATMA